MTTTMREVKSTINDLLFRYANGQLVLHQVEQMISNILWHYDHEREHNPYGELRICDGKPRLIKWGESK